LGISGDGPAACEGFEASPIPAVAQWPILIHGDVAQPTGDVAGAYESGIVSTGSARLRMSVKFHLVAVFFVIFAWVICFRQAGWAGYVEILVFIGILVAALVYLWREGALDWAPGRKLDRAPERGGDGS